MPVLCLISNISCLFSKQDWDLSFDRESSYIRYFLCEEAGVLNIFATAADISWLQSDPADRFRRNRAAERKTLLLSRHRAQETGRETGVTQSDQIKRNKSADVLEKRKVLMYHTGGSSYLNPPTTWSAEWELDAVRMDDMNEVSEAVEI